jgi:hypothetical protein
VSALRALYRIDQRWFVTAISPCPGRCVPSRQAWAPGCNTPLAGTSIMAAWGESGHSGLMSMLMSKLLPIGTRPLQLRPLPADQQPPPGLPRLPPHSGQRQRVRQQLPSCLLARPGLPIQPPAGLACWTQRAAAISSAVPAATLLACCACRRLRRLARRHAARRGWPGPPGPGLGAGGQSGRWPRPSCMPPTTCRGPRNAAALLRPGGKAEIPAGGTFSARLGDWDAKRCDA